MADKMSSFAFLEKYKEIAATIPKTKRLHFLEGLIEYGLTGKQPEFTGIELTAFVGCQTLIDSCKKISAARSANGQKGGKTVSKTKQSQANGSKTKQTQPKEKEKENIKDSFSLPKTLPEGESAAPSSGALSPPPKEDKQPERTTLAATLANNPDMKTPGFLRKAFGGGGA